MSILIFGFIPSLKNKQFSWGSHQNRRIIGHTDKMVSSKEIKFEIKKKKRTERPTCQFCFKNVNLKSWHIFYSPLVLLPIPVQVKKWREKNCRKKLKIATFWMMVCILWTVANANLFHCRYSVVIPNEFRTAQ